VNKSAYVNNIQLVQTCCKEKLGKVEEPLHQIYISWKYTF